jgi:predicted transcriptional regulator
MEEVIMKQALYTKSLTIALSPDLYEKIKEITDEKHISIGEWVRDAIEAALLGLQQKEEIDK